MPIPPIDGEASAKAWEDFYARPMRKKSTRTIEERVVVSDGQISMKKVKPKRKVKRGK